ncbi:MAG: leucine-rich repeat protein [Clostridia bacterium]|nr:leucine-rich repeat protein [Clostridia bacterium]
MKKAIAILLALLFALQVALLPAAAEGETPSDVPELTTIDDVTAYVRNALVSRSTELRFRADDAAAAGATLNRICQHTGNGAEGDYLRLALNYVLTQPEQDADGVYTLCPVYYTTAEQEAAVDAYVQSVVAGCTAQDATGIARYLYDYLCEHVTFDLENLYNDADLLKYTAYGAAVNGRAVCQGFAQLYYKLALAAGLDCRIVTGTRGDVAHAWNIIQIDDLWYHVDASSGAQLLDNSAYFMKRLFDGYTIRYGEKTASEIQGYSFVLGNEGEDILTGTLNNELNYGSSDSIVWRLNTRTGAMVISGTGAMPSILFKNGSPFWNNTSIKSVVISEGITNIPNYLFNGCSNLTEISIPSTVTTIESNSFLNCPIESIYLNPDNPVYSLRGDCLIHDANKALLLGTSNSVIPNDGSVESIGGYAFYKSKLKNVTLPDGLKSIGGYAFCECTELTELVIPASVTIVFESAFENCTGLQTLTTTAQNDHDLRIWTSAFMGCTGLTDLTLSEGLKEIYTNAFAYCTELRHLSLPKTVSSIEMNAFNHCGKLESITVDPENSTFHSTNNCLINAGKRLIAGCSNSVIPDDGSVIYLGPCAFSGCETLTSIEFPDCLKSIGGFNDCTELTEVTIPENVETIQFAFNGCSGLTKVTISAAKTIDRSFQNCTGLTELSFPNTLTEIGGFSGCSGLTSVTFPESLERLGGFENCNNLIDVSFSEGLKTLCGFKNCTKLTSLSIPTTVKEIYSAFDGCVGLTSLAIPNGVESIKGFSNCTGLTSVILPESVTQLDYQAFGNCYKLKSVKILSRNVSYFDNYAFANSPCTIYGFAGSTVETFAHNRNFSFIPLCPLTNEPHNAQPVDVTEPDCLTPGYSAGTFCPDCGEWITGHEQTADALGHDPGDPAPENVVAATCTAEGSYDNVTRCTRCGEVLASTAEKIAMTPHADNDHNGYCDDCGAYICEHPETSLQNDRAPACLEPGYTGDTVCTWCGATVTYGVTVPATGHSPAISRPAKDATCLDPGATAEVACTVCHDVITPAQPTPIAAHSDGDGDGRCDVCLAPTDCTQYGRCGDLFWYADNGNLVISGSGASGDLAAVPWESCADSIDCVYLKAGVTAMDGAPFAACPGLAWVFAPAGATVSSCEAPVLDYSDESGVVTVSGRDGAPAMDLPALLNAASVLCTDRTVAALCFERLSLCATDGGDEVVYDILKNGKIIDEHHFRLPSGTELSAFRMRPLSYPSFNTAFAAIADNPDRTLILSLTCDDMLPTELKSDSASYTEQFVLHFVDEPTAPDAPDAEKTFAEKIVERFQATLAAILSLFKKLVKLFKR